MNPNFKTWLIEDYGLADSAANSRVANILTIERCYGNIDTLLQNGGAQNLLNELSYSTEEERKGLPQKHKIPIHGNIRTGSATLKQAVKKYIAFYNSCEDGVKTRIETVTSQEQPTEDIENDEIESNSEDVKNSILDILGISRLESVHTNFLKWLLEYSWDYPILVRLLIQSILKKTDKSCQLEGCSKDILDSIGDANSNISYNGVTSQYNVIYQNSKGQQYGSVDLVIDAFVNDEPIKIIIENKVFSPEHDNQTKIYHAYFSGDDSEVAEYGIGVYKNNLRYRKGKKKNQIKKLRSHDGGEHQLFVFLCPIDYEKSMCKNISDYFITYTYHDLMEDVIFPSMENGVFSTEERIWIADYVGILITPDKDGRVMANECEKSKKLIEFKAACDSYSIAKSQNGDIGQLEAYGDRENADKLMRNINQNGKAAQIRKVERRVPGWRNRPHQINSKILSLFMELSHNGKDGVFLDMLEDEFGSKYPDDARNFTKNYNQMKNYSYNNHAKVFSEDDEKTVWLWQPVKDFIINTFS